MPPARLSAIILCLHTTVLRWRVSSEVSMLAPDCLHPVPVRDNSLIFSFRIVFFCQNTESEVLSVGPPLAS